MSGQQTFVLEITPWEDPDVVRVVELLASSSLHDLHNVIQRHFELDNDHLYAFFMTNRAWDRRGEYGSGESASDPVRAKLSLLALEPGREFLYIFDFGDELRHTVRVREQRTAEEGGEYPRLLESHGEALQQYLEEIELSPEVEELATQIEEALKAQGARGDKAPTPEDCSRDAALVKRMVEVFAGKADELDALSVEFSGDLELWLGDVPQHLADAGRIEEALELTKSLEALLGEFEVLEARARVLVAAGRKDEATRLADELLEHDPEDVDRLCAAAAILQSAGELARAEEVCRAAVDIDGDVLARATLVDVLRARGKEDEAERIEREMNARLEDAPPEMLAQVGEISARLASQAMATATVRREGPKVGRNDACPCGSGKKFKKCCGA